MRKSKKKFLIINICLMLSQAVLIIGSNIDLSRYFEVNTAGVEAIKKSELNTAIMENRTRLRTLMANLFPAGSIIKSDLMNNHSDLCKAIFDANSSFRDKRILYRKLIEESKDDLDAGKQIHFRQYLAIAMLESYMKLKIGKASGTSNFPLKHEVEDYLRRDFYKFYEQERRARDYKFNQIMQDARDLEKDAEQEMNPLIKIGMQEDAEELKENARDVKKRKVDLDHNGHAKEKAGIPWSFLYDDLYQAIVHVGANAAVHTPMIDYLKLKRYYHILEADKNDSGGHVFNAQRKLYGLAVNKNNQDVILGLLSDKLAVKTFFPKSFSHQQIINTVDQWYASSTWGIVPMPKGDATLSLCSTMTGFYGWKTQNYIVLETAFPLFSLIDLTGDFPDGVYIATIADAWDGDVMNQCEFYISKNDLKSYVKNGMVLPEATINAPAETWVIIDEPLRKVFGFPASHKGTFVVRMNTADYDSVAPHPDGAAIDKVKIVWS